MVHTKQKRYLMGLEIYLDSAIVYTAAMKVSDLRFNSQQNLSWYMNGRLSNNNINI